jgi:hypothetical protein
MKKAAQRAAQRTALWLAVVAMLVPAAAGMASSDDSQTLKGQYFWNQNNETGPLEAVFTPTGEGRWAVAIHFKFQGRPHLYLGSAEGSLTDGLLKGEVKADHPSTTFVFEGTVKDGKFQGTHAELSDGEQYQTGTLTLG